VQGAVVLDGMTADLALYEPIDLCCSLLSLLTDMEAWES
jgi:hypothetical protein